MNYWLQSFLAGRRISYIEYWMWFDTHWIEWDKLVFFTLNCDAFQNILSKLFLYSLWLPSIGTFIRSFPCCKGIMYVPWIELMCSWNGYNTVELFHTHVWFRLFFLGHSHLIPGRSSLSPIILWSMLYLFSQWMVFSSHFWRAVPKNLPTKGMMSRYFSTSDSNHQNFHAQGILKDF